MTKSPNTTSPCEFYPRLSRRGCPDLGVQKQLSGHMLMPRTGHDGRGCHSSGSAQRMMGPGKRPHLGRLVPTSSFSVPLSFRGTLLPRPQTPHPDFTTLAFSPIYPKPAPPPRLGDKAGLGEADPSANLPLFTQSGKTTPASRPTPLPRWSTGIPWPPSATPTSPTPPGSGGM